MKSRYVLQTPNGMANTPLTPENFEKLLSSLNPDRDLAGQEFELLWLKLCEFFRARRCHCGEDLADEAINRLARKLAEGEDVHDVMRYSHGLARLIWLEYLRKPDTNHVPLDDSPVSTISPIDHLQKKQEDQFYLHCLQQLPEEERTLIIAYCEYEGQVLHEVREKLANSLGISLVALRIRITRIRKKLEICLAKCLKQGASKMK
ncbi:MAG: sigma-70 family RNA polymerase sigma factor [Acidobacteria bacterium]|nr:sigma-70 family RNA polymerase sigma factor [Acidobacteriota bacterium]